MIVEISNVVKSFPSNNFPIIPTWKEKTIGIDFIESGPNLHSISLFEVIVLYPIIHKWILNEEISQIQNFVNNTNNNTKCGTVNSVK